MISTTSNNVYQLNAPLETSDYKRISQMKVLPKALVIKQLIGKRRNAPN